MQGIMFKPDMTQAIEEGRKTQTRRLSGLKGINECPDWWKFKGGISGDDFFFATSYKNRLNDLVIAHPRYHVGEVVYCKETLSRNLYFDEVSYKLDGAPVLRNGYPVRWCWKKDTLSSMFMPAWAARRFIRITGIRAERLQEITEEEIAKEGISITFHAPGTFGLAKPCATGMVDLPNGTRRYSTALCCFQTLWGSIKPKFSWMNNPWVWVYEFVKCERLKEI